MTTEAREPELARSRYPRQRQWIGPLAVGLVSAIVLLVSERIVQARWAADLPGGYRFQQFSSDDMMQTLKLGDMVAFGPRWIIYDHVYPPLEDLLRYVISAPQWLVGAEVSIVGVDLWLYALAALGFGLINAVLFAWIRTVTGSSWWALGGAVAWALVPGYIMTMQMLDPSPLATLFITTSLYTLFMFLKTRRLYWTSFFYASLLLASLSRSVVQGHVLLALLLTLWVFWRLARSRRWFVLLVNISLVALIFVVPVKQQLLFGTLDASSFGGYHRSSLLWLDPRSIAPEKIEPSIEAAAGVFTSKFNSEQNVRDNITLSKAANNLLLQDPLAALAGVRKTLGITFEQALRPSTDYTENAFVDMLPWKDAYGWLLSGWRYLLILVSSVIMLFWLFGSRWVMRKLRCYGWFIAAYLAFAVPLFIGNRYLPGQEDLGPIWTEITRQRIFIDPPLFVLVTFSAWAFVEWLRGTPRMTLRQQQTR